VRRLLARGLLVVGGVVLAAALAEGALRLLRLALGGSFAPGALAPHPGKHAILCVGDSHTFGLGVQHELESFPVRLEVLLNGGDPDGEFAVLNLGVPGANTALVAGELERALARTRFDLVVVLAGYNDEWNLQRAEPGAARSRLLLPQLLRWIAFCLRGAATTESRGLEQDERGLYVRHADGSRQYVNVDPGSRQGLFVGVELSRRVEAGLDRIVALCRERGVAVLLETYACRANDRFEAASASARRVAQRFNVPLVDQAAWFDAQASAADRGSLFQPDGHPTDAGYLLMARATHAKLVELAGAGREPYSRWRIAPVGAAAAGGGRERPAASEPSLLLEPTGSDSPATLRFEVRGPPGGAWRLAFARTEAQGGHGLGLKIDELFGRSRGEVGLGGRFDATGKAQAWVARTLFAPAGGATGGRVLVQLLLVDPYGATLEEMLLAASPVRTIELAQR